MEIFIFFKLKKIHMMPGRYHSKKKGKKKEGDWCKKRNACSYGHFVLIERLAFCRQKNLLCKVPPNYTSKILVGFNVPVFGNRMVQTPQ